MADQEHRWRRKFYLTQGEMLIRALGLPVQEQEATLQEYRSTVERADIGQVAELWLDFRERLMRQRVERGEAIWTGGDYDAEPSG